MAFPNIFKKKIGGGFLGNIIRRVGDQFSGGMVSRLLPAATAADVDAQEQKWASKGKKFTPSENLAAMKRDMGAGALNAAQTSRGVVADVTYEGVGGKPKEPFKFTPKIIGGIVAGVVAVVGIIIAVVKGKKNKPRRRR
jgi:hypothetical protein